MVGGRILQKGDGPQLDLGQQIKLGVPNADDLILGGSDDDHLLVDPVDLDCVDNLVMRLLLDGDIVAI